MIHGFCVDYHHSKASHLERRYHLIESGALAVCAKLREKIRAGSVKVRNFIGKSVAYRQNNMSRNNQSQLYKELGGSARAEGDSTPDANEAREFCSKIWSVDKQHNDEASWLGDVRKRLEGIKKMDDV